MLRTTPHCQHISRQEFIVSLAQIEEKLYSVDSTSSNYYQNVIETKDWYNTLNAAQKPL